MITPSFVVSAHYTKGHHIAKMQSSLFQSQRMVAPALENFGHEIKSVPKAVLSCHQRPVVLLSPVADVDELCGRLQKRVSQHPSLLRQP